MHVSGPSAELLFNEAKNMELSPQWETHYGLFSILKNNKRQVLFYSHLFSNSQLGSWIADNKHTTHIFLESNNILTIPYYYGDKTLLLQKFFTHHAPVVQKPIMGKRSKDVYLITKKTELPTGSLLDVLFEKYIDGIEYRYLVLGEKVIAVQKKIVEPTKENRWEKYRVNIEKDNWDAQLVKQAVSIAKSLHMSFLAVDFMVEEKDKWYVLEVNANPGFQYMHEPHEGKPINVARKLLEYVLTEHEII